MILKWLFFSLLASRSVIPKVVYRDLQGSTSVNKRIGGSHLSINGINSFTHLISTIVNPLNFNTVNELKKIYFKMLISYLNILILFTYDTRIKHGQIK